MIETRAIVAIFVYVIFLVILIIIKDWSMYKFERKCRIKIKHLQLKERYELVKRITR